MRAARTKTLAVLAALLLPAAAWALDYRSVAAPRVILYDVPSAQGKKLYVARQYYPVEVVVDLGDGWIKVRDARGEFAWIEAKQLDAKRTVLVKVPQAEVHETADAASKTVFRVEQDVALELAATPVNGWVKVRHRDGLTGYLPINQVWGL
ncbi:MAG: hypothetical protein LBV44_00575 [Methylobacillus sp.]|jgi:SH3-like domain-containing protein|nr:hypothetical protein [Methylobacillus sp.]